MEQWRKSGQSARVFAGQLGVNPHTLSWWRSELARERRARGARSASVHFVEVTSSLPPRCGESSATPMERFEVVCASGRVVRVPSDFDAMVLRRLLDAVEGG